MVQMGGVKVSTKHNPCNYKNIRKRVGLTAQEVATRLGVSISTVFSWESGKTSPDSVFVAQLARLYGCTADELIAHS